MSVERVLIVAIMSVGALCATDAKAQVTGKKYTKYPGLVVCQSALSLDRALAGVPLYSDCIVLPKLREVTYIRSVNEYELIDVSGTSYFALDLCRLPNGRPSEDSCFTPSSADDDAPSDNK